MKKIIVRIIGGLGNQLFSYSASRRLAVFNNAELVIDNISGFSYDKLYNRKYVLNNFNIDARIATSAERLEPFGRYRRYVMKKLSEKKPFDLRSYLVQEENNFDVRLLSLKFERELYMEGYWQSELYFKDIENIIRQDLKFIPPKDIKNKKVAELIQNTNAVCIHVRWFDPPQKENANEKNNLDHDYYQQALAIIRSVTIKPHFFVFSDYPVDTLSYLNLQNADTTFIRHNKGDENAYADLWLMSLCKHFIIANSTFSWWGAWLCHSQNKIIIAPKLEKNGKGAWGFKGLVPENWVLI